MLICGGVLEETSRCSQVCQSLVPLTGSLCDYLYALLSHSSFAQFHRAIISSIRFSWSLPGFYD